MSDGCSVFCRYHLDFIPVHIFFDLVASSKAWFVFVLKWVVPRKERNFMTKLMTFCLCLQDLHSTDIGNTALFLCSPLARAITGVTLYADMGLHAMGLASDSKSMQMED